MARIARVEAVACDSVRGGRLIGWTQRPCGAVASRRHVGATPAEWAPFAQRNADLAASLSGCPRSG